MISTLPMTVRGAELLKAELDRLKTKERPAVIQAITEARAQGDLSENADYDAARDRQGFIEARIRDIEGKLSAARVIDPKALTPEGRVIFAATVDIEDGDGNLQTWQIVGEDEADIKAGLLNFSSPLAKAMIGRMEGDSFEVETPGGKRHYEIVAIRYT